MVENEVNQIFKTTMIQVNRHLFHTMSTTQSEILTVLNAQQDPH